MITLRGVLLGACTIGLAANQACSERDSLADAGEGGAEGRPGAIPERPRNAPRAGATVRTFAVDTVNLGRHGFARVGYNLDGLVSEKAATEACASAIPNSTLDGDNGIDNAFGQNIVPLLDLISADHIGDDAVEASQNRDLRAGVHSLLLQAKGLPEDGTSALGLTGQLFVAASLGSPPTFTTKDAWPVGKDFIETLDPLRAKTTFADSYVRAGVFVSGAPQTIALALRLQGQPFRIEIRRAVVSWRTTGPSLVEGTIAGIVDAQALVQETKVFERRRYKERCDGATDKTIETFGRYADILLDGKVDPSRACDGVSLGIGFTAKEVQNPTLALASTDPSADAVCQR